MRRTSKRLLRQIAQYGSHSGDLHVIRFYSSYIFISEGKIIDITTPHMRYCPLAGSLYRNLNSSVNSGLLREVIAKSVSSKISELGYFTSERELFREDIAIPYGASEILMYAMRKRGIEAAVVVCDGAGTVIVNRPELVQGIGARMNGLFYTTPIEGVIRRLKEAGSLVVFRNGDIDQVKGVEAAVSAGYKNVAVTVNASTGESFGKLRRLEKKHGISLVLLAVCTTGITSNRIREIEKHADIVWSCASEETRTMIGRKAILQLSKKIPVFVLTAKGLDLISMYSSAGHPIKDLDLTKQYFIGNNRTGIKIRIGNFDAKLSEARLPVRHSKEPILDAVRT